MRTVIERYKRKAKRSIGFGIAIEDPNPIRIGLWEDVEWKPDPKYKTKVE